jgi:anaerobic magnesium-protoporphyrin IX monomethyl ester cyclase
MGFWITLRMQRAKVVLYNPSSVFFTMPLALLAIGSYLDPLKYEVRIIDARLEKDDHATLLAECRDAICLGVSVLTGAPIHDALTATRKIKSAFPAITTVWGGWHASLFPEETLAEASIDLVVAGQGEISFSALLDCLVAGESYHGTRGIYYRNDGVVTNTAAQPMKDINSFPPLNYDLIPVERFFQLKKRRQLDYISSQGCRFRCSFCADPVMYKRGWYGFSAERMGEELETLWRRYRFNDVNFQDETFFTNRDRVQGIAEQILARGLRFTWFGTMRADQGVRMDEDLYRLCKRSGLRKVMIGIEAGSQSMMDWMKKDIKIEQVFESAARCVGNGIAVIFNIIVGFPHETEESIRESLRVAVELRKMSPDFEMGIFYFKPYPGNAIADQLIGEGYRFPVGLEEWAGFDYVGSSSDWITKAQHQEIESFKFYQRVGWNRPKPVYNPLRRMAQWRCEKRNYALPVEKILYELIRPPLKLS